MNFGIWELLIVLVIVALLFGTAKLRNIGSDLGSALKSFRSALKDDSDATITAENSGTQEPGAKLDESRQG